LGGKGKRESLLLPLGGEGRERGTREGKEARRKKAVNNKNRLIKNNFILIKY
jgi:hypothetical protein